MDSVDAVIAITLFLLAFFSLQQYLPLLERIPNIYDPFFLCSAGSPGHWYLSDGVPGMGLAFRRCNLTVARVDEFFTRLSSQTSQMKDRLGLTGKRLRIRIEDYNNGTVYYSFSQSINRPNIYRYEIPASLNSTLVKIVVEVGST